MNDAVGPAVRGYRFGPVDDHRVVVAAEGGQVGPHLDRLVRPVAPQIGVVARPAEERDRGDLGRLELVAKAVDGHLMGGRSLELEGVCAVGPEDSHCSAVAAEHVGQAEIDLGVVAADAQQVDLARAVDLVVDAPVSVGGDGNGHRRTAPLSGVEGELHVAEPDLIVCLQREGAPARRLEPIPEIARRRIEAAELQESNRRQRLDERERSRVLVLGRLAGQRVAVLVERRSRNVENPGAEDHRVRAGRLLRIEEDFQRLRVEPAVSRSHQGAFGADEAEHVVGGREAGLIHGAVEIDPDGLDRSRRDAFGRVARNPRRIARLGRLKDQRPAFERALVERGVVGHFERPRPRCMGAVDRGEEPFGLIPAGERGRALADGEGGLVVEHGLGETVAAAADVGEQLDACAVGGDEEHVEIVVVRVGDGKLDVEVGDDQRLGDRKRRRDGDVVGENAGHVGRTEAEARQHGEVRHVGVAAHAVGVAVQRRSEQVGEPATERREPVLPLGQPIDVEVQRRREFRGGVGRRDGKRVLLVVGRAEEAVVSGAGQRPMVGVVHGGRVHRLGEVDD